MKSILLIVLVFMVIMNLGTFVYGRKYLRKLDKGNLDADANYKKGIKYVIFSVILSFLTIIGVTVIVILNVLSK